MSKTKTAKESVFKADEDKNKDGKGEQTRVTDVWVISSTTMSLGFTLWFHKFLKNGLGGIQTKRFWKVNCSRILL
jgi:hypothetical protein